VRDAPAHRAGEDDRFRVLLAIRSGLNLQQSINRSGTVLGRLVVRERERLDAPLKALHERL